VDTPKLKKKARRHQLEPISYDELLGNAGMSGFVSFLDLPTPPAPRDSTVETGKHTGTVEDTSARNSATEEQSYTVPNQPPKEIGTVQDWYVHYVGISSGQMRRERIYRARTSEEGHSFAEQAVYEALWSAATPETATPEAPRTLRIGYDRLARLTRLSWVSVKANLRKLEAKLAIQTIAGENSATREGKAYRIFSPDEILNRREQAGLLWVRRTRGVELLPKPEARSF